MYLDKTVAVVVPCHNEEKLLADVVRTMPYFVDRIIVVDDNSEDLTGEVAQSFVEQQPGRVELIALRPNQGVGGAIAAGYKRARDLEMDVTVVMAGDGQMDPADLHRIVEPVATGQAAYTKGNRLFRGESWKVIPKYRYLGNSALSLMTKIASGYWNIADSQSGYCAISLVALKRLNLDGIYKRYGMPNDMLIKLNINNFKVRDVSVRPVYGIGERSGIRLRKVIPTISWLLAKGFCRRMVEKYVIRDFHPLIFFYFLGLTATPIGLLSGAWLLFYRLFLGPVAATSALFSAFLIMTGMQTLFFAMWFDMEYNKELR
ncbi:MAG: glycosyltransferase family 2 protein [Candidatus Methylomirabilis sp.]|nr:glycosyltransferase family 2 protein [Deltaproteobacteria bacterium]